MPVSQHTGEVGCYLTATEVLGALPQVLCSGTCTNTQPALQRSDRQGASGTVVESFEKVWLYTIAESEWRASIGEHIATIGPLPISAGKQYTARYMEAVFPPGMRASIHRHSGPEAWYLVSGTQCLETPEGITMARTCEGAVVPERPPMALQASVLRRADPSCLSLSRHVATLDHHGERLEAEGPVSEMSLRQC
jgi:hypothetical protein